MKRLTVPIAIVVALVLLRFATCDDLAHCLTQPRMDFHAYYCGGARALAGEAVYGPTTDGSLPYLYPPPSLLLFMPLALLPFVTAQACYYCVLAASAALWLAFVRAHVCRTWLVVLIAVVYLPMLHQSFTLGQITPLVVALSVAAWWLLDTGHDALAGVALAASLCLKPTELWWFALAWLACGRRSWRFVASVVVALGWVAVVSLAVAPEMTCAWPWIARSRVWLGGFPHHYLLGSSLWLVLMSQEESDRG